MRRPLVLIAVLLAGLALNACGKADEPASEGETEAVYLDLDGLQYQVQISRQLNPYDVEDSYYVRGQNEPAPARDDTWFGVFVRVYNPTDTPKQCDVRVRDPRHAGQHLQARPARQHERVPVRARRRWAASR